MAVSTNTGIITQSKELHSGYKYIWIVEDFTDCYNDSRIGHYHESPPIVISSNSKCEWTLDMYVAGYNCKNASYVGIRPYLSDEFQSKDLKFIVAMSVLDKNDQKHFTRMMTLTYDNVNTDHGTFQDFVLRSDLWKKPGLMTNDDLKIVFEIWIGERSSFDTINQLQCSQETSSKILEKLWEERPFTDFKFIVRKIEFCVHRGILSVASPVFRAMLDSRMREANEAKVEIEDVEPEVMEKTLRFIYTGNLDGNGDYMDKLLVVADRYQLDNLKQLCENIIIEQLDVDNVYKILLLADQSNAENLKKKAIEFFLRNTNKLISTAGDFKASITNLPVNLQTEIICTFMTNS